MYIELTSKQRDVLIACLLLANRDENDWVFKGESYKCKPGQFITSLEKLAKNCSKDVSIQSVRTALSKLEKWGFLTNISTNSNRLITICKWGDYQISKKEANKPINKEITKRLTNDATTNKKEIPLGISKNEGEFVKKGHPLFAYPVGDATRMRYESDPEFRKKFDHDCKFPL
jgi:hypothetical protein